MFITRRTVCRFYLLRPDRELNEAFLYCLAVAAAKFGILLHAVCVMSTHVHLVITDVRGVYPDFLQCLNRLFANVTKVLRGWGHEVFNGAGPSAVPLRTPGAIVDKSAYTIANPVACGAVKSHRDWPGFVTRVEDNTGRRGYEVTLRDGRVQVSFITRWITGVGRVRTVERMS